MKHGIRRQLGRVTAVTSVVTLLTFLVPVAILLDREAEQRAAATTSLRVQAVAILLTANRGTVPRLPPGTTVFLSGDRIAGAPAPRDTAYEVAATGQAFVTRNSTGVIAFTAVTSGSQPTVVRSVVPAGELRAEVVAGMSRLALVALALLVLSIVLADRVGRRLVRSAEALGDAANRLSRGDLAARVVPRGPVELQVAGHELNGLADRIDRLLADQRAEAAAVAHRLRTPLTALRVEAELVPNPAVRERLTTAADALTAAVDEVVHTTLRAVREGRHPATELVRGVAARLDFWSALAEETGRELDRELPGTELWVPLTPEDLDALIDVLLDNVFTHTPPGTGFRVQVRADPPTLTVEDTGTGTSTADRPSTGVGLELAARLATRTGGSFEFVPGPSGSVATATFGTAAAPRHDGGPGPQAT